MSHRAFWDQFVSEWNAWLWLELCSWCQNQFSLSLKSTLKVVIDP